MEKDLIWITGASNGIGKSMAIHYAEKGHPLILSSRNFIKLEEVSKLCREKGAPKAVFYSLDMENPDEIENVAHEILKKETCPKIIVHSAGISQRSLVLDTQMEVYRRIMEIDYFGLIHLSKILLPKMIEMGGGKMVVISSLVGKFSTPLRSGYSAAKHALHGFFDALRTEHQKDNIKVCIICPGFIKTDVSVNALTGNGKPQNEMDQAQANGMPVDVFARKAFKAIARNKNEVYIGGKETFGVHLNRFFPTFFRSIIIGRAKVK